MRPARNAATVDLVGGVQHGRRGLVGAQRCVGEVERWEARAIRRFEIEAFELRKIQPRQVEREPLRMGQRHGDRDAHVGQPQLGQHRAVPELHQRMDDRLRMHHHFHLLRRHVEEPSRLDQLEPLVHERRRVDRDLGPHRPVRVPQGFFDGSRRDALGRPGAKRSTGSREQDAREILPALAGERLEDGAVLAVHWQQRHAAGAHFAEHQGARHDEHFLVGQRDVAAGANAGQRGLQAGRPHERRHQEIGLVRGHRQQAVRAVDDLRRRAGQPCSQRLGAIRVADRHQLGLEAPHLLCQLLHVASRRQRDDAETLGKGSCHGQRLLADAAGAAQDGDPLQARSGSLPLRTCALVSPKRRSRDW